MAKIGRNAPCPCGSGKKFKHCHSKVERPAGVHTASPEQLRVAMQALREHEARERVRRAQQGHGSPIISIGHEGYRLVAVGSTLYYSPKWKSFHDFLMEYIAIAMGREWGAAEFAKPYEQRHPVLQWAAHLSQQRPSTPSSAGVISARMTGAISAYLRLAYNLYLLAHNTRDGEFNDSVQRELIKRLKHPATFPGAYYEADIFAALIRAGYEIEFEDQSGKEGKRCEARIRSKRSGAEFSIEAKSVHRQGAMGADRNVVLPGKPLRQSIRDQLYKALGKVAPHRRIIFIDVNLPDDSADPPAWIEEAADAVESAEGMTVDGKATEPAYVILTNRPDHHAAQGTAFRFFALGVGFKIADFGRRLEGTLIDLYRAKQRHLEGHDMVAALAGHSIPATFDGELPSITFAEAERPVQIGEVCRFQNDDGTVIEGTAVSVAALEDQAKYAVALDTGSIVLMPMSDALIHDFRQFGDLVFGAEIHHKRHATQPLELFEFILDAYRATPKARLLELMKNHPDIGDLSEQDQPKLALLFAERTVLAILADEAKSETPGGT